MIQHTLDPVSGDGNCMISSIAKALSRHPAPQTPDLESTRLRRAIYAYMFTPEGTLIRTAHAVSDEDLLNILPTYNSRGDYLEYWAVIALQEILNINIQVYHFAGQRNKTFQLLKHTASTHRRSTTISIIHHNSNHFSGLFPYQPP
jgi:OTU-like cysteine protease